MQANKPPSGGFLVYSCSMASKAKIKALDTVFSKYTRLRDMNDNGYGYCCSCGKSITYSTCDAGHFINRKWMALRWDERNVHAQCRACNRFDEGNNAGYFRFMQRRFGDDTIDLLLSKKVSHKWTDFELDILIKEYKEKIKALS